MNVKLQAIIDASAKGLQTAMEKARQTVKTAGQSMKNSINAIGNAFGKPIDESKKLSKNFDDLMKKANGAKDMSQMFKQVGGSLFGMGSQIGIIIKGFQSLGMIINEYVIDPIVNATKRLAEFQQQIANGAGETGQERRKRLEEENNELRAFVDLLEKYRGDKSEINKTALQQQQKKLSKFYGIDITPDNMNDVLKEQLDYQKNMKIQTLTSESNELKKANSLFKKRLEELYSSPVELFAKDAAAAGDAFKNGGFGAAEYARQKRPSAASASLMNKANREAEIEKVTNQQNANQNRIQEIQNELNKLNKTDDFSDLQEVLIASKKDTDKKRNTAFKEWENSVKDTAYQAEIRKVMQRYAKMIEDGADAQEAKNLAELEISHITEKYQKEYANALAKSIDDYKNAFKNYLDAQKQVAEAQKKRAQVVEDLEKEERKDQLDRRRENIEKKKKRFGFTLDRNPLNQSRRDRRNIRLDQRIADKLARQEAGERVHFTRREEKRLNEYMKLEKKDRNLQAAQKQMAAADKQSQAAERLLDASNALKSAITGRDESGGNLSKARKNLSKQRRKKLDAETDAWNVTRDFKNLTAPGVKKAPVGSNFNYTGQFQQLHNDLVDLKKKAYFVK